MLSLLAMALAQDVEPSSTEQPPRPFAAYAVPLLSYDSNLLFGYGAYGQAVITDPSGETPYRASVDLQLYWTTGGYRNHFLRMDLPALAGSRFRVGLEARRIRWSRAPYTGVGGVAPLTEGVADEYYLYSQERHYLRASLRTTLTQRLELLTMYDIRGEVVDPYPDSLLLEERPSGVEGGRYAWGALGLIFEDIDKEVDPHLGFSLDGSLRLAHPWLGSDWSVWGANARYRRWHPLSDRWVFAGQVMGDLRFGDEPFFNQAYAGGMGRGVVGGRWILKGLAEERYRGDGMVFVQPELRWTFWAPTLRKAHTAWMLVPFVDLASIWTWEDPQDALAVKTTAGLGLRVNVRDLIVFRADAGVGLEAYDTAPFRRPDAQIYVLSEHPF